MTLPRLLFTTGGFRLYGKERVVLHLIRGLATRGHPVAALTNAWSDGAYRREVTAAGVPAEEAYLGWVYPRRLTWTIDSARHAPGAYATALRLYRRFRPDVVLHDSVRTVAQLGWRTPGRNLLLVQDYHTSRFNRLLVHLLDPLVRVYVACSEDVRRDLLAAGVAPVKIRVIGNPAYFEAHIRRPPVERDDVPTAGIIGQVIERKGHHVVVEALARIRRLRPDFRFRLRVFGDGPHDYQARIRSEAERLGVADLVEWCGYQSSQDQIYSAIELGLVPTVDREPFGLVAVEPAVYGKPVIATATGGLPEIVRDGVTGYLIPPGDPDALADRMIRLLADSLHTRTLGETAFADYKVRFDSTLVVNDYAEIINTVVSDNRRG